jgi:superfamily II DNA/RNA helicase
LGIFVTTATSNPVSARPNGRQRPHRARALNPVAPAATATDFASIGVPAALVSALSEGGIHTPTPIQTASIPDALAGRDVLGRAHTGSGKTLAFGLPMLSRLAAADAGNRASGRPRGLVVLPTRELAQQVETALRPLARRVHLTTATVVGGASMSNQIQQLRRGVDVLIATPGRLLDLLERRALTLDGIEIVVLDEADHMADLGFMPAVTRILDAMPSTRQCLLYSATLDRGVDKLVTRYLHRPVTHRIDDADLPSDVIDHRVFRLAHTDKTTVAAEIASNSPRSLFFVRTKHGADRLARQLRTAGVSATALHGNLNQNQRRRALDAFSTGKSTTLVATDVAARGLHIDSLDLVVHYDPPTDAKVYAHRSGRTARAGATGTVLALAEPHQQRDLSTMHAAAGIQATTTGVTPGHPAIRSLTGTSDRPPATATVPAQSDRQPRIADVDAPHRAPNRGEQRGEATHRGGGAPHRGGQRRGHRGGHRARARS